MAVNYLATFSSHDSEGVLYDNTFGVKVDNTVGAEPGADFVADQVKTWIGTEYRACLSGLLTLDTITCRKMPYPVTAEAVAAIGLAGTQTAANDLPKELAVVLSWKTNHVGRSGRGHIALPCTRATAELATNASLWNVGAAALFTTQIPALFAKLASGRDYSVTPLGGHISHIVYSRKDDAGYDVTARVIRSQVRWVRRRQTAP